MLSVVLSCLQKTEQYTGLRFSGTLPAAIIRVRTASIKVTIPISKHTIPLILESPLLIFQQKSKSVSKHEWGSIQIVHNCKVAIWP